MKHMITKWRDHKMEWFSAMGKTSQKKKKNLMENKETNKKKQKTLSSVKTRWWRLKKKTQKKIWTKNMDRSIRIICQNVLKYLQSKYISQSS